MLSAGVELGECVACLSGAALAEAFRPSVGWRGTVVNVLLGIAGGAYGPGFVEVYIERLERVHRGVTFVCAFLGGSVLKWLADQANDRKFFDWIPFLKSAAEYFRNSKPPEGGGK